MKTSNKILLGAFITALLLFGSLYAAVYIKFKKINYTSTTPKAGKMFEVNLHLDKINYVLLRDVIAELYNADKQAFQFIESNDESEVKIKYEQRGDSLFVSEVPNIKAGYGRIHHPVKLYLDKDVEVHAESSHILLQNTQDNTTAPSFSLALDSSSVTTQGYNSSYKGGIYYDRLQIKAKRGSQIELRGSIISKADISLEQASLDLYDCTVDQFNLRNDRSSKVIFRDNSISWQQK